MKKMLLQLFLWIALLHPIVGFSQGIALDYNSQNFSLFFGKKPIPTWVDIVINPSDSSVQYNFIPIFSIPFDIWGWKEIDQKIDIKATYKPGSFEPDKKHLDEGWFYTSKQPSNVPDSWLYSPTYSLYFNLDGIQRLDRFFKNYLGEIPFLVPSVTQNIKVNQFFRIIIPPDDTMAFVDLVLPENIVIAYKTTLPKGSGERIFVLYIVSPAEQDHQLELIRGTITYKDGKKLPILYKIRCIQETNTT